QPFPVKPSPDACTHYVADNTESVGSPLSDAFPVKPKRRGSEVSDSAPIRVSSPRHRDSAYVVHAASASTVPAPMDTHVRSKTKASSGRGVTEVLLHRGRQPARMMRSLTCFA